MADIQRAPMFRGAMPSTPRRTLAKSPSKKPPSREMQAVGRAILWLRKEADLSQEAVADRMNITRQAWQQYEAGERQIVMRSDVQEQIAEALGTTRDTLLMVKARLAGDSFTPAGGAPINSTTGQFVGLADPVRAGAFLAIDTTDQSPPRLTTIGRDPRYPLAQQRIRPVVGDSMNERGIMDGDWVHIISIEGMNFVPETGLIVEVEKTRLQERERELTLKELEVTPDGLVLWPRSSNPIWREPIRVVDDPTDEDTSVRITGVMKQLIRHF